MRQSLERWLHAVWYDGAASGWVLLPLSVLYRFILAIRSLVYRLGWRSSYQTSVPVVVVGNLTAGGVGKTPFVVWLVNRLQQQGYAPGVVTRGYGGLIKESTVVADSHSAKEVGDEAKMLAQRLSVPVVVGKHRANSVGLLESSGVNIIVADDGLQHYALARDVEICVVDELRQFGNQRLLPAGPLREPMSRLSTVDVVVTHRQSLAEGQSGMTLGNAQVRQLTGSVSDPLESWQGQTVHAVAGVGNPERFFSSLEQAGLTVIRHAFIDHHRFVPEDLDFDDTHPVLMTDKDAVKCQKFAQDHYFSVRVDAMVSRDVEQTILDALE